MLIRKILPDIITEYEKSSMPEMQNILGALYYFVSKSRSGLHGANLMYALMFLMKVKIIDERSMHGITKTMSMEQFLKKSDIKLVEIDYSWCDSYLPKNVVIPRTHSAAIVQEISLPETPIAQDQASFLLKVIKNISLCIPKWSISNSNLLSDVIMPSVNVWERMANLSSNDPYLARRDYLDGRGGTVDSQHKKDDASLQEAFKKAIKKSMKFYPFQSDGLLLDWLNMKAGQDLNRIIDMIVMSGILSQDNKPLVIVNCNNLTHNVFGTRGGIKVDIDIAVSSLSLYSGDILYYDYDEGDYIVSDVEKCRQSKETHGVTPDVMRLAVRVKLKIIEGEVVLSIEELGIYSYTDFLVKPKSAIFNGLFDGVMKTWKDIRLSFDPFKVALENIHSLPRKSLVNFRIDLVNVKRADLLVATKYGSEGEIKLLADSKIKNVIADLVNRYDLFINEISEESEIPLQLSEYLMSRIDAKFFTAKLIYEIKYIQKLLECFDFQSTASKFKVILKSIKLCHYFYYNDKNKDDDFSIDKNRAAFFKTEKEINTEFLKQFPLAEFVISYEKDRSARAKLAITHSLFAKSKINDPELMVSDRRLFKA